MRVTGQKAGDGTWPIEMRAMNPPAAAQFEGYQSKRHQ